MVQVLRSILSIVEAVDWKAWQRGMKLEAVDCLVQRMHQEAVVSEGFASR